MKARFLNKNNNSNFEVDEGSVISICKNETLDSAVIRISNLSEANKLNIEPFDTVILSDFQLSVRKMLIDNFTETITCLNPKTYSYEIHLFSLTKDLENYLCPNLKITALWGHRRSIITYITEYLELYGPKIRVQDGNSYKWVNKYDISPRVINKFNVDCPEMQWNQPTLREVLNDLMMVLDCIVYINYNNEIDYMNLTSINNDISNDTHINYITSSQSSDDYVSELKVNLVNVTNSRETNVVNTVTRYEWCHVSSDNFLIDSDNWFVETQYPIYKIKKLKLLFFASCTYWLIGDNPLDHGRTYEKWIEVDLMNAPLSTIADLSAPYPSLPTAPVYVDLIYEKQEWDAKKTYYQTFYTTKMPLGEWPDWKNYCLYYTRNSNKIDNFTYLTKYGNYEYQLIYMIEKCATWGKMKLEYNNILHVQEPGTYESRPWMNMFYIEYETLQDAVFTASKNENPSHKRTVIDNQTNSYVDAYNQGFLEYQKANRLGNLQLQINARYLNSTNYEDSIESLDFEIPDPGTFYVDGIGNNLLNINGTLTIDLNTDEPVTSIPTIIDIKAIFHIYDNAGHDEYIESNKVDIERSYIVNGILYCDLYCDVIINENDWDLSTLGYEVDSIISNGSFGLNYTILSVGDYYEDSVVYETQYQIYKDHVEVNAIATKNYVLRNYFTGVKAKIRSWKIADGSEALIRHELNKYYLEFSFSKHNEAVGFGNATINYAFATSFLHPLSSSSDINPVQYSAVRTITENVVWTGNMSLGTVQQIDDNTWEAILTLYFANYKNFDNVEVDAEITGYTQPHTESITTNKTNGTITIEIGMQAQGPSDFQGLAVKVFEVWYYPHQTEWYLIDTVNRVIGNSMVFTFGFKDNYYLDKNFDPNVNNEDTIINIGDLNNIEGGIPTQYCRYVDDNGEFEKMKIRLLNSINLSVPTSSDWSSSANINFLAEVIKKPQTTNSVVSSPVFEYNLPDGYIKDNQEIAYVSTQFELCSDTTDISFTKEFVKRQDYVRTISNVHTFTIKSSTEYNFRNLVLPPDSVNENLSFGIYATDSNKIGIISIRCIDSDSTRNNAVARIRNIVTSRSLYIVDENNVVLFAINGKHATEQGATLSYFVNPREGVYYGGLDIYINLLKDRDKTVYDNQINQLFIKSI